MEIKRIVGQAKNSLNSVVAELDNGLYVWVPVFDEITGKSIVLDKNNIGEYTDNAYAASWLYWDKWVDIMANGELNEDLVDTALYNIYFMIANNPPGEYYLGSGMSDTDLAELKEEEKKAEEWCKENPGEYDISAYDIEMDELDGVDDEEAE